MAYTRPLLDVAECIEAVDGMLEAAAEGSQQPMALAVVDEYGALLAFASMDGTSPFVREFAIRKAYTAALMRADLKDFGERRQAQGRSVADYGDPKLVGASRGGVVISRSQDGRVLGGIGISGGTPEEDDVVARVGLARLNV